MAKLVIGTDKTVGMPAFMAYKPTAMPLSLQYTKDNNGVVQKPTTFIDLDGATGLCNNCLSNAYMDCSSLTGVIDLSNITSFGENCLYQTFKNSGVTGVILNGSLPRITSRTPFQSTFQNCIGITGTLDLSGIRETAGNSTFYYTFNGCTGITFVNLCNLVYVGGPQDFAYTFSADNITGFDLSRLSYVGNTNSILGMFSNSKITTARFDSLVSIRGVCFGYMFSGSTLLTDIYFPVLKYLSNNSIFSNMLSGCTGVTIHFPSNLDPQTGDTQLSQLTSYPNFGGTDTVLVFDQPASLCLRGNDNNYYYRNPIDDISSALAWRKSYQNIETNVYTSGTANPSIGDTLYSDDACTTAVTTISSIS